MSREIVSPSGRKEALRRRRVLKMAKSPESYVRGNTARFYEWIQTHSASKDLAVGPPLWICGDCHIGNLGPIADLEGNVEIQIRDLDQTVVGNPTHDLLRLGLSLAMSARSSDLSGITTAFMIEAMIRGYRKKLLGRSPEAKVEEIAPIEKIVHNALKRNWRNLAKERIEGVSPEIPLGRNFWPLTKQERDELQLLLEGESNAEPLNRLTRDDKKHPITMLDAAYWVKGCSSLGRLRYAVLLKVGSKHRLIDVKEAARAIALRAPKSDLPRNNAERIVSGASRLSPFLGERMMAANFLRRQFVLRELRPQDIKFDFSSLSQEEAIQIAGLFGGVVGKAHGRQMQQEERYVWARQLENGWTKTLHAPSWLWNAVKALVVSHESSYLRHCRRFALKDIRQKS